MPRMTEKRRRRAGERERQVTEQLSELAREHPEQFRLLWNERLQRRQRIMRHLAANLSGPSVLTQVDEALRELRDVWPAAPCAEASRTRAALTAAACTAISSVVDSRLQKLTSTFPQVPENPVEVSAPVQKSP